MEFDLDLDDDIVNTKRLIIMTVLFVLREITESELLKATGMSWGSLSTHIARLEKRGYVERRRVITKKGIRTVVRITELGYRKYVEEVKKLRKILEFD